MRRRRLRSASVLAGTTLVSALIAVAFLTTAFVGTGESKASGYRDCGSVKVSTSPPQRMRVWLTGAYSCSRARRLIVGSVKPGPTPLVCSNNPGQRPRKIVCAGHSSIDGKYSRVVAVRL
jgi:hypothetical protein